MQLIIFGAPGVGKGTQAKIISEKLNIRHISTGDILRDSIQKDTVTGHKAKEYMDKGFLVPDEIIGELVKEALDCEDCHKGFILDGYPRTIDQVKILDNILAQLGREDFTLIKLDADVDQLVDRLTSRRECLNCKSIVNLKLLDKPDTCPVCGKTNVFAKRKDDDAEIIRNRLKIYNETTRPVLDYYMGKKTIVRVVGTNPIEKVTEDILAALKV
ncbi:MAG: adenylate kinase [Ignavibacteriae bacterium HGW-Ignavibacteriae-2]|jgi:adenylate kinase|nr:adenylate kinase [Bacteroidota bacterium]PKL88019.1 MAG: adenylate kinase [Ignavibacteriae bacterium HGW-Ignavibacteriae-2]